MHRNSVFWFKNDCRIHDNAALCQAAEESENLLCIYIIDSKFFLNHPHSKPEIGAHRWHFLKETLDALNNSLKTYNQELFIIFDNTYDAISKLVATANINAIYTSETAGSYENDTLLTLKKNFNHVHFYTKATHTLYSKKDLPFELDNLPKSFTQFRKKVENKNITEPLNSPKSLPPILTYTPDGEFSMPYFVLQANNTKKTNVTFQGGEHAAQKHLSQYFNSDLPTSYKEVRNELDGWDNSTKFSAWLANGSLSARQVFYALKKYETEKTKNESTYWIFFELLWREYFQWYAHTHKANLFKKKGITNKEVHTSFYPQRYQKWINGTTPYPIVNACMRQLNQTGFMSNRGRQLVASCFVNELGLDWRYGASYFEKNLIDYDVASNWGNWQYLAGVGADPRGKRQFDLNKQTKIYDPQETFINKWQGGNQNSHLDSVDAADWPID